MPSLPDGIVIFVLALLLFGPKKLPVLARELGKWIGEFRRASNEFKMQMEDELRLSEQAERQKEIAAMEAAAPIPPGLDPPFLDGVPIDEPEHPHLPSGEAFALDAPASEPVAPQPAVMAPLPIAVSGDLSIMPPSTGLPAPQSTNRSDSTPSLGALFDSIPHADAVHADPLARTPVQAESPIHG